jgi:hypothetical protein
MPMYFNRTNHDVTIFLNNAVPIKFLAGEHKRVKQEGLEKQHARFLIVVPDPLDLREAKEKTEKKVEKGLINEVKQPDPNKELVKEPVTEDAKKGGKKVIKETPKLDEGYSPWRNEQTVASTGRQGKE